MDCVVARIQHKGTARDIERRLDSCFFGSVSGCLESLTTVFIGKCIVPYAVPLPCLDINGSDQPGIIAESGSYAIAMVDEIEKGDHIQQRISVVRKWCIDFLMPCRYDNGRAFFERGRL